MKTTIDKDPAAATMTVTTELDVTVERTWQLWADPRQLERWWGPPGAPATVTEHDLTPGATVRYFMSGEDGAQYPGLWDVVAVEAPHRLELVDRFVDDSGARDDSKPSTTMVLTISEGAGGGSIMRMESRFASAAAMEELAAMGMEEGLMGALGQIEGILAADAA